MSERFPADEFDAQPPDVAVPPLALPGWLADRLLRADEKVTWVYGPRWNPPWERYVTHPALFLVALALAAGCLAAGWRISDTQRTVLPLAAFAAGAIVLGSIFVLGLASGYFTRLVVTTSRLAILQGYEVVRTWGLDELPPSLIRYRVGGGGKRSRAVDLDALSTLLGGASDKFAEAKSI